MFGHFALGTQANPSGLDPIQISPKDTSRPAPCKSASISPCTLPADVRAGARPTRRTSIDSLASKLSNQHIQLDDVLVPSPRRLPLPLSPIAADLPLLSPSADVEMEQTEAHPSWGAAELLDATISIPLPDSPLSAPSLMDDASGRPSSSDSRTEQRRPSGQFHSHAVMVRTKETLVEDMIASGDQCVVYQPPASVSHVIEVDPNMKVASMALEVDDSDNFDLSLVDSLPSLRRASGPGGIRKHGLRYRSSADVAMSCANVVRSKPRMRRRRIGRNPASPYVHTPKRQSRSDGSAPSPSMPCVHPETIIPSAPPSPSLPVLPPPPLQFS